MLRRKPAILAAILIALVMAVASPSLRPSKTQRFARAMKAAVREQGFKLDLADFARPAGGPEIERARFLARTAVRYNVDIPLPQTPCISPAGPGQANRAWASRSPVWDELEHALDRRDDPLSLVPSRLQAPVSFASPTGVTDRAWLMLPGSLLNACAAHAALSQRAGRADESWTYLFAVNALAARFQAEPVETSHLERSRMIAAAFGATWEAIQARRWSDSQLASLQDLWRASDPLDGIEEIPMYRCAQRLAELGNPYLDHLRSPGFLGVQHFFHVCVNKPRFAWSLMQTFVAGRGVVSETFREEVPRKEFLAIAYYRDHVLSARSIRAASDWRTIRTIPAATNHVSYRVADRESFHMEWNMVSHLPSAS